LIINYRELIGAFPMTDVPRARAAAAVNTFINELRAAFERAGPPTYARLEELSERCHDPNPAAGPRVLVLAHSTTHGILTRKHGRLPGWPWVNSLIYVLRVAAAENGLDPETIGTTTEWHAKYLEVLSTVRQAEGQAPPLSAPTPPLELEGGAPPRVTPMAVPAAIATRAQETGGGFRRLPTVEESPRDTGSDRRRSAPAAGPFSPAVPHDWRHNPHAYESPTYESPGRQWPVGRAASSSTDRGERRESSSAGPQHAPAPRRRGTVPPPEPTMM
jgi:hypothetical protein